MKDRDTREGPGFKLGESLVLHVGLGLEGGYDSNATYTHDPITAGRLRITPYLDISTRTQKRIEPKPGAVPHAPPKAIFRFGFSSFYDRYFSKSNAIDGFNSKFNPFGFDTHLNFTLLPERKVSVLGGINYIKTLEPLENNQDALDKHNLVPMVGLRFLPGGGTLTIEPKYRLNLLYFSSESVGQDSNRYIHEVSLNTNWKIFPMTALISNVIFAPTIYYGNYSYNVDSYPLRSWFGFQGLLFDKVGFRALAGYGAGFYEWGPSFEGFIGDGAVMFFFNQFAKATIGIKRDFGDSFYANYYIMTGGYLSYEHMFAGRFLLTLSSSIYKRKYAEDLGYFQNLNEYNQPTVTVEANTTQREDIWVTGSILGELRATDWLSFHLSVKLWRDISDFAYTSTYVLENDPNTPEDETGQEEVVITLTDFSKVEFFGGVRIHY
ncbi:MAG: hypothetical protein JXR45_15220 [Deltaproteobacteria bacterium]|nr:hypothetical protein [Deltaproteobacteria bacterium]